MLLKSWYRVEVHQGPPKDGEVRVLKHHHMSSSISDVLMSMAIGKSLMSKEINEVTGLVRLFTSPNKGMKPADGIIRAVTIITNEDEEYGFS